MLELLLKNAPLVAINCLMVAQIAIYASEPETRPQALMFCGYIIANCAIIWSTAT